MVKWDLWCCRKKGGGDGSGSRKMKSNESNDAECWKIQDR